MFDQIFTKLLLWVRTKAQAVVSKDFKNPSFFAKNLYLFQNVKCSLSKTGLWVPSEHNLKIRVRGANNHTTMSI